MSLEQLMSLAQTLKLSPTLLQSMSILQMNTQELSDYLNDLALENPVMAYTEAPSDQLSWEEFSHQVPWLGDAPAPTASGEGPAEPASAGETDSLALLVNQQLDRLHLTPPLLALCRYLAETLDDHGRLDPADLEGLTQAGVPAALIDQAVETLQSLDPAGLAARSLSECLALQLRRLPGEQNLALRLCDHLDLLARGSYSVLAGKLGCSEAQVKKAAQQIQTLDPNPVGDLAPAPPATLYTRPDAWVAEVEGRLQVFVNHWDLPQFHVSQDYLTMAKTGQDPEAAEYLRQKLRQAQWVLQCVQRRQNTLERCLTALAESQSAFFLGQAEAPGPLLRRELAEQLEVHPSTITRTLGHKYIQCRQGLFPTSYFFSRKTGNGDSPQSEQAVKARMARMFREEDPRRPYSDQAIAEKLAEEGIPLARRTVAKYRQAMGVAPSHRRKQPVKPGCPG